MDQTPSEDQEGSNEWVVKLRRILDAEIPSYLPQQKKVQSIISEKSEDSSNSFDGKNNDSDCDSGEISFLEVKTRSKEEEKQKQKRDLYLRIGEEIKENQEIEDQDSSEEDKFLNEQETDEIFLNKLKEEMEEEYQSAKNTKDKQSNLVIMEMNVFERIKVFDAFNALRRVFKQVWIIQSNLSLLCFKIVTSKLFENITLAIILFNCVFLSMEDPTVQSSNASSDDIELTLLILYTIEMVFKVGAYGFVFCQGAYIRNPWNILDFVIIFTGYLPFIINNNSINLNAIRSLRVLRPLRTISTIKSLKQILNTLFDSLPLLKDAVFILLFFYIVFAIAGQQLFSGSLKRRCFEQSTGIQLGDNLNNSFLCSGDSDCSHFSSDVSKVFICGKGMVSPYWDTENFDSFGWSLLNVYVIVSQEGWVSIMTDTQQSFAYPSFIFFLVCVLVGNMFLENLLMAIIQIKYQENERLLKQKQKQIDNLKMYSLEDFKKWGIYKSNKVRYKEIEENKLKKVSSFGEIVSFFMKTAKFARSIANIKPKLIQRDESNDQSKQVEEKQEIIPSDQKVNEQLQQKQQQEEEEENQHIGKLNIAAAFEQKNKISRLDAIENKRLPSFLRKSGQLKNSQIINDAFSQQADHPLPSLGVHGSAIATIGLTPINKINKDRNNTRLEFFKSLEKGDDLGQGQLIEIKDIGTISYTQNVYLPKLHPIKTDLNIMNAQKKSKGTKNNARREINPALELNSPALQRRSIAKKSTKLMGLKKSIIINTEEVDMFNQPSINLKQILFQRSQIQNNGTYLSNASHKKSRFNTYILQGQSAQKQRSQNELIEEQQEELPQAVKKNSSNSQMGNQLTIQLNKFLSKSPKNHESRKKQTLKSILKNDGQQLIIPAKQVQSEDEQEEEDDYNMTDEILNDEKEGEDFLERIQRIEEQNKKLITPLEGNQKETQLQLKDNEIEILYKPKVVHIEHMLKKKQENMQSPPSYFDNLKEITQVENYLPPLPSFRNKMSSEQISMFLDNNLPASKKATSQSQSSNNDVFKSNDKNLSNSKSQRKISIIPSSPSPQNKKMNSQIQLQGSKRMGFQPNDEHQKNFSQGIQEQSKLQDIIFFDEDFFDYQEKKEPEVFHQNQKKHTHLEGKLEEEKQQKKKEIPKQEEKAEILKQVFNKDEGKLYKQLFANKKMIAQVFYQEINDHSEEILPRESRIKREQKKKEIIEKIKKIKFQIIYSAEKRVQLRSELLKNKSQKQQRAKTYTFRKSKYAQLLIQQQAKVYDVGIIDAQMEEFIQSPEFNLQQQKSLPKVYSVLNQEPFNKSNHTYKYKKKESQLNSASQKEMALIHPVSEVSLASQNQVFIKQKKDDQMNSGFDLKSESQRSSKSASIQLDPQVNQHSSLNQEKEDEYSKIRMLKGSMQNQESPSKQNESKKIVKSILKQKIIPKTGALKSQISKSNKQQNLIKKKGQGDKLIFNWDVEKALEIVFPSIQDLEQSFHKQEDMSSVFGENFSIYSNILDQNSSRLSIGSSQTSRGNRNSSFDSKESKSSVSSFSSLNRSQDEQKSNNSDSNSKRRKSDDKNTFSTQMSEFDNLSEEKESKNHLQNQDGKKEGQVSNNNMDNISKLDQVEREPIEIEYIRIVKQQVNNLVNKGIARIKESWSGDEVLPTSKMLTSTHSINILLKSLNYNYTSSQQNEGGIAGIINAFRRKVKSFISLSLYDNILMICVIMNTVILALDGITNSEDELNKFNEIFTYLFAADLVLKLTGLGVQEYVSDKMNIFDATIVALSIFDMIVLSGSTGGSSFSAFRSLRILRVFRVLRITRILRQLMFMKILVQVIVSIIDKLVYIMLLLLLYLFIYTLIGMQIYGGKFQQVSRTNRMTFDSFLEASFTVFDLLTIENWNTILQIALRTTISPAVTVIYLISCIFIGNFIIMNLVLATMIGAFNSSQFEKQKYEIGNQIEIIEDLNLNTTNKSALISTSSLGKSNLLQMKSLSLQNRSKNSISALSQEDISMPDSTNQNMNKLNQPKRIETQDNQSQEEKESSNSGSQKKIQPENDSNTKGIVTQEVRKQEEDDDDDEDKNEFKFFKDITCKESLYIFSFNSIIRKISYQICKQTQFDNAILMQSNIIYSFVDQFLTILRAIILSSLKLISDTYFSSNSTSVDDYTKFSYILDIIFSVIFAFESLLKIISYGLIMDEGSYLRDYWSQLDFFVVISSLIDVSYSGVDLGAIKILRLFRTLRPLRLLNHNKSMKLIVTTLLESMTGILNMVLVLFLVWLMFAILGVSLMKDKLSYCNFPQNSVNYDIYSYQENQCKMIGGTWATYDMNFDNVGHGLLTLFVYSTFEGWPTYSWNFIDATSSGPVKNSNGYFSIFICTFILVGSFFSIDLFGAVLAFHYNIALQKSKNKYLSDEQSQWIELQRLILKSKPDYNSISQPTNKIRLQIWKIAESQYLEILIMICIIFNIISMSLSYDTSPSSYDNILSNINLAFSSVFILECLLKIIAYGINGYFYKSSNSFDFFVVSVSIIDIIFTYSGQAFIKFLSAGPQIARIFRVFRVTRLLRSGVELDHFQNFSTFHRSFLLLFRLSTGEDWYVIMFDVIHHTSQWSALFFIIFIVVQQYVMMNLFVLIIIQQFEENYINPDNPLNDFKYSEEDFKKQWVTYTRENFGAKIHERFVTNFYFSTLRPLGFDYKNKLKEFIEQVKKMNEDVTDNDLEIIVGKYRIKQKQLAEKSIMQMRIKCDYDGFIYFNELLYYFFKHSLYSNVFERTDKAKGKIELQKSKKADLILMKEEHSTMKKLKAIKKYQATLTKQKVVSSRSKEVNPMVRTLFVSMCFKSWQKFSSQVQKNMKQLKQEEFSSDSESDDYSSEEDGDDTYLDYLKNKDSFYQGKEEDNIFNIKGKERKQIISRQHTIYLRNQKPNQSDKKNSLTFSQAKSLNEQQFFQMPNAIDIYKEDYSDEENPQIFQQRIDEQLKKEEEEAIQQKEEANKKAEQQQQYMKNQKEGLIISDEDQLKMRQFSFPQGYQITKVNSLFTEGKQSEISYFSKQSKKPPRGNNLVYKKRKDLKQPSISQLLNSSNSQSEEEQNNNKESLTSEVNQSHSFQKEIRSNTPQKTKKEKSQKSPFFSPLVESIITTSNISNNHNSTSLREGNPKIQVFSAVDQNFEINSFQGLNINEENKHTNVTKPENILVKKSIGADQMPSVDNEKSLKLQIPQSPSQQSQSSSENFFQKKRKGNIGLQQKRVPILEENQNQNE